MISYRRFRNTDPPSLVDVWNDAATGRGAYPLRTPGPLERWLFSKPYFTPDALTVAEADEPDGKKLVGFSLAGLGPNEDGTATGDLGVVCCVLVRPAYRKQGIGRELLRRAEASLTDKGATKVVFGSMWPDNPYLFGLYGGSNSPGVLASEPDADAFLTHLGWAKQKTRLVMQRKLDAPLSTADARFNLLRRRYEAQLLLRGAMSGSWWQESTWGSLDPSELRLFDKLTGLPAGRAVLWELEGFSWRWNAASAGIFDVQVRPDLRRQGLSKLMLLDMLRFLQEQFYGLAELHVPDPAEDPAGHSLCLALGFEQVDSGHTYTRPG